MKIIITENQLRKLQFKFLNYLFDDIYEVKSKKYPVYRFWKKGDKVVLELEKSGNLWVLHTIWNNISYMFSLDYDETKQLIKEWVEQHLELEEITPIIINEFYEELRWNKI
jgi:hypothetical protein